MKQTIKILSINFAILLSSLLTPVAHADTSADLANLFVKEMGQAKGLIARVPVQANGDISTNAAMEFRVDNNGVGNEEELAGAWEAAKDVPGFANISQAASSQSGDSSTCYYCGYYYYRPYVSYYYSYSSYWYYWYFTYPVYIYRPVYFGYVYYYYPIHY